MKRFALLGIILILFLLFIGCPTAGTDDEDDSMTKVDAYKVFHAANNAQGDAMAQGIILLNSSSSIRSLVKAVDINVSLDGVCGGNFILTGSADGDINSFTMDLSLDFNDYCFNNIILNGSSNMVAAGTSTSYYITYTGDVTVSGDVTGSCTWDLTMTITETSISATGKINDIEIDFDYTF